MENEKVHKFANIVHKQHGKIPKFQLQFPGYMRLAGIHNSFFYMKNTVLIILIKAIYSIRWVHNHESLSVQFTSTLTYYNIANVFVVKFTFNQKFIMLQNLCSLDIQTIKLMEQL